MKRYLVAIVAASALTLPACGGGDEPTDSVDVAQECLSYEEGESKQDGIDECFDAYEASGG